MWTLYSTLVKFCIVHLLCCKHYINNVALQWLLSINISNNIKEMAHSLTQLIFMQVMGSLCKPITFNGRYNFRAITLSERYVQSVLLWNGNMGVVISKLFRCLATGEGNLTFTDIYYWGNWNMIVWSRIKYFFIWYNN